MIRFTLQTLNTLSLFSGLVYSFSKKGATSKQVGFMMVVSFDIPFPATVSEKNAWKCSLAITLLKC